MYTAAGQPTREQLVQRFMPLVKRIAYHLMARLPPSVQFDDLVQNGMLEARQATIDDILLLFIYLELGAMVGIYFKTNHMPVRFLIYVAITALTRLLIADIQHTHKPNMGIVMVCGAILLLALATLVVRYGSHRFPSPPSEAPPHKRVERDEPAQ